MLIISNTYQNSTLRNLLISSILVTTMLVGPVVLSNSQALADNSYVLPAGENVIGGEAYFDRSDKATLNIKQGSERLYIDWHKGFDIGSKSTVNFYQPDSNAVVVNRVVSSKNNPTQIMGALNANGRVIILDENGIIFGKNSRVDVGGLIASTGNINEKYFLNGDKSFTIENIEKGKIINQGSISIADSGLAAFVAPHVRNDGLIVARKGTIVMGNAKAITFDLYGDGLIEVVNNEKLIGTSIENKGKISTEGGQILLTAVEIDGVVKNLVNLKDIRKSDQFRVSNGKIILSKDERLEIEKKKADELAHKKAEALKLKVEKKAQQQAIRDAKKNPPVIVVALPAPIIVSLPAPVVVSLPAPVQITPPVVNIPNPTPTPIIVTLPPVVDVKPAPVTETPVVAVNNSSIKTSMPLRADSQNIINPQKQENESIKNNRYILENYGVRLFSQSNQIISSSLLNALSPNAGEPKKAKRPNESFGF